MSFGVAATPPVNDRVEPAAEAVLAARELACRRGERLLFDRLDFELQAGEILWLRGANGRGKTSLLRLLAGLSSAAEGDVIWRGRPLAKARSAFSRHVVYIAHANALKDDLTVLESLQFLLRLHGRERTAASCVEALGTWGLMSRRHAAVRTLSQGQRRRVALARLALETEPTLWLLDEPYDALDTDGIAALDALLVSHATRGGSVVLASHVPLALRSPVPRELALSLPRSPISPLDDA